MTPIVQVLYKKIDLKIIKWKNSDSSTTDKNIWPKKGM